MKHGACHALGRFVDRIDQINSVICALLLALVVVIAAAEIVARSVFASSSIVLVDLSLQLAVLMYFIGYFTLLSRNQDIVMDYFYVRFPASIRKAIDVLTIVGVAAFFIMLLVKSFALFRLGLRQSHPVFPIPNAVVIVPALIGAAGGVLVALRKAIEVVVGPVGSVS